MFRPLGCAIGEQAGRHVCTGLKDAGDSIKTASENLERGLRNLAHDSGRSCLSACDEINIIAYCTGVAIVGMNVSSRWGKDAGTFWNGAFCCMMGLSGGFLLKEITQAARKTKLGKHVRKVSSSSKKRGKVASKK